MGKLEDARHLWFALREWPGQDPEWYFGDLGAWAERRMKELGVDLAMSLIVYNNWSSFLLPVFASIFCLAPTRPHRRFWRWLGRLRKENCNQQLDGIYHTIQNLGTVLYLRRLDFKLFTKGEIRKNIHALNIKVNYCNMNTSSGSHIQSRVMEFICLSYDYFGLLDLISCPELFSDSSSQYYV